MVKYKKEDFIEKKDLRAKESVFVKIGSWLKNLIFPRHLKCIFCGDELNSKAINDTCENCHDNLPKLEHFCLRCGGPVEDNNDGVCFNCKANNFNFVKARSVFAYSGDIVKVIHKFKFGRSKYLYEPMAEYMCDVFSKWDISVDIITSVPLHKNREKVRGYNQSKLLAEFIAEKFNIKYLDLVEKVVDNTAQATLDMKSRRENVKDVYKPIVETRDEVKGKTILLIDDIMTTGATSDAVSKVLLEMKAKEIFVLTFAHSVDNRQE